MCFFLGLSCMGLFLPLGLYQLFPFPCWGNFQIWSLQKCSHTLSFSLLLLDSYHPNVGAFDIVPEVFETIFSSFHSFYFILLFRNYFYHFIFQLTDSFFCFKCFPLMDKAEWGGNPVCWWLGLNFCFVCCLDETSCTGATGGWVMLGLLFKWFPLCELSLFDTPYG